MGLALVESASTPNTGRALTANYNGPTLVLRPGLNGFIMWWKVTAVHADTTVSGKLQHSANGSDWEDVAGAAFANLVGVAGFESVEVTAKLLPHTRLAVTLAGVTKEATVHSKLYVDTRS